jgi:hypothetical protein
VCAKIWCCAVQVDAKKIVVGVCALKFGVARCRVGNARKILVCGCAHLNLALWCRVVMHEK